MPTHTVGRLIQLGVGLVLFASGRWLALQAGLGIQPWDVLHVGIARWLDVQVGTANVLVGLVLMCAGLPLGLRPGVGTLLNMVVVGVVLNGLLGLPWLDEVRIGPLAGQLAVLLVGVLVGGVGSALYVGAHIGIGPRDGLMVAIHRRRHIPVGLARSCSRAPVSSSVPCLADLWGWAPSSSRPGSVRWCKAPSGCSACVPFRNAPGTP